MEGEYHPHHCDGYLGMPVRLPRQLLEQDIKREVSTLVHSLGCASSSTDAVRLGVVESTGGGYRKERVPSVYLGTPGVAMSLLKVVFAAGSPVGTTGGPDTVTQQLLQQEGWNLADIAHLAMHQCRSHVPEDQIEHLLQKGVSFHFGIPGMATVAALAAAVTGHSKELDQCKALLTNIASKHTEDAGLDNEVLFGRAGFLYCLGLLQSAAASPGNTVFARRMLDAIMAAGVDGAATTFGRWSLMWSWRKKEYLGGAHGVVGILQMLLQWEPLLRQEERNLIHKTLQECVGMVRACNYRGFPTKSTGTEPDAHHWCHGLPGLIMTLVLASTVLRDDSFLDEAKKTAERLFHEGLLRKGTGLCHGVSGNAYCFLTLYRATREARYLHYALAFYHASRTPEYKAAVASYEDPQRAVQGTPDAPLSLMEGSAGYLCFLVDLLYPDTSYFPGYELPGQVNSHMQALLPHHLLKNAMPAPKKGVPPSQPKTLAQLPAAPLFKSVFMLPNLMHPLQCEAFLKAHNASAVTKVTVDRREHRQLLSTLCGVTQRMFEEGLVASRPEYAQHGRKGATSLHSPIHAVSQRIKERAYQNDKGNLTASAEAVNLMDMREEEAAVYVAHHIPKPVVASVTSPVDTSGVVDAKDIPRLEMQHAFVIRYGDGEGAYSTLPAHTDPCDVTLNLCLRRRCLGGTISFDRLSICAGEAEHSKVFHKEGDAFLFFGDEVHHTHRLHPLENGDMERVQLVMLFNMTPRRPVADFSPIQQAVADRGRPIPLLSLIDDVLGDIMQFLDLRDVAMMMTCCRRLNDLYSDDYLWSERYKQDATLSKFYPWEWLEERGPWSCEICDLKKTQGGGKAPQFDDTEKTRVQFCAHCSRVLHHDHFLAAPFGSFWIFHSLTADHFCEECFATLNTGRTTATAEDFLSLTKSKTSTMHIQGLEHLRPTLSTGNTIPFKERFKLVYRAAIKYGRRLTADKQTQLAAACREDSDMLTGTDMLTSCTDDTDDDMPGNYNMDLVTGTSETFGDGGGRGQNQWCAFCQDYIPPE